MVKMPEQTRIVSPAFPYGLVRLEDGTKVRPPAGWELLEPGDAGLTRRVKAAGPTWTVQNRRGRRTFSLGVWAPAETIAAERARIEAERATPQHQKKLAAAEARRDRAQSAYVEDFRGAVQEFLDFAPPHAEVADRLAQRVTAHATPVGSGTVARTQRIPIEQRAEAAVIAWMRHHTTVYDELNIARAKGLRREIRQTLARQSRAVLASYRRGEPAPPGCPLAAALRREPG